MTRTGVRRRYGGIGLFGSAYGGPMHPQGGRLRAPPVADTASKKEWQR
nr:MAG TPA: hypothetical protein [Caudoviricetes sp.]